MSPTLTTGAGRRKVPEMEELLFGLTPAEWWAWNYLIYLAQEQGSTHIILPRPGADPRAEKIMTRRHLKNILKALRAKFHLTNLIIPRSKSKRIEVLMPAAKIGVLNFRNVEKDEIKTPNKQGLGAQISAINGLGKSATPISAVIQATLPNYTPPQAKLKERLEKLLKLSKQGDLKGEIGSMSFEQQGKIFWTLRQVSRYEPKSKKLSQAARIYAMVRLLQSGEAIERPQAWVDQVARAAEREIKEGQWKGDLSARSGRSLSPRASGERWGSTKGRL
jgi:hypothetical protein